MKKNKKKKKIENMEPQYINSFLDMPAYNYNVYYMSKKEKTFYSLLAFLVGGCLGLLFYGGFFKNEFGDATFMTHISNLIIFVIVGIIAKKIFIPIRTKQILEKKRHTLKLQFRDMLEALNTSLGAGKNVVDSFLSVRDDLKIQYEAEADMIKELDIIIEGIRNNIHIEDILEDLGRRSGIEDIQDFANVFKICYHKGGNIKETVKTTHSILSEKMEIVEDIQTVVTSTKSEQNMMLVMPIVIMAVIKGSSPEFAANFATLSGFISTTISILLFVAAYYIGKSILNIKI